MRVHIVCRQTRNDTRIIPRLARLLAEGTGWSLSGSPLRSADLNVFLPYLEAQPVETRTAAWFTHRDEGRDAKVEMWDQAAGAVGLRLTSARIYLPGLEAHGPSALVTPPLDREKFRPGEQSNVGRARPVVGTSGYVYPGGRKGEDLLAQLAQSKLARSLDLRASGRGWPVPTVAYTWPEMQRFYQALDVYICTSSIEGVGYGPLEALACGVRVVVPSGVGVFDDLPEGAGIRHYPRGDYAGMVAALEAALSDPVDVDALRAATERYTVSAWCGDHQAAVAASLAGSVSGPLLMPQAAPPPAAQAARTPPQSEPGQPWRGRAGLYLVAYGEPSRKCATLCINTWRRHMPDVPVALCSDKPLGLEDLHIAQPEADVGARSQKTRVYDLAPVEWEYVLYLDADTELIAPVPFLFDALADGWELVICKNPGKFALSSNMIRPDNRAECEETWRLWGSDQTIQLQGGVFGFRRCEATERFFHTWHREWDRYGKRDQAALLRAYWHEPPRTLLLGNQWNLVPTYDPVEASAGIVHHPQTARRWEGVIAGRADSPEAWAKVRAWERAHV